jgi:hypothetical protein
MEKADTPDEAGDSPKESSLTTNTRALEKEAKKDAGAPSMSAIYVDDLVPATLTYAETSESYPTMQAARTAWLALPAGVKKDASITITGGGCYRGWEIYQLFPR